MKKIILISLLAMIIGCGVDPTQKGSVPYGIPNLSVVKKCIEGHVYYYTSGGYEGGIAPKLTDEGKPVKCAGEEE
jgi:hypothetical protein